MNDSRAQELTVLLQHAAQGEEGARAALIERVYDDLRRMAAGQMGHERAGHTLNSTALVHEAWIRLFGDAEHDFENRREFFAAAAESMRRILVDHAQGGGEAVVGDRQPRMTFGEMVLGQLDGAALARLRLLEVAFLEVEDAQIVQGEGDGEGLASEGVRAQREGLFVGAAGFLQPADGALRSPDALPRVGALRWRGSASPELRQDRFEQRARCFVVADLDQRLGQRHQHGQQHLRIVRQLARRACTVVATRPSPRASTTAAAPPTALRWRRASLESW